MSYGSTLLAEYPSSYSQPTASNNNHRNSHAAFENSDQPDVSYRHDNSVSNTAYQPPSATTSRKPVPPSHFSVRLNEIPEYEESLATASSVARSIHNNNMNGGSINKLPNSQQNPNRSLNENDNSLHPQPNRNLPRTKNQKQSDEIKTKPTFKNQKQPTATTARGQPVEDVNKRSPADDFNEYGTSVESSQSINIETWIDDTKKKTTTNEKPSKPAWSIKTDHSHVTQVQHDKPLRSKIVDNKSTHSKTKPITNTITRDKTFDKNSSRTNTSHHSSPTNPSKYPKSSQYDPPSPKRVQPTITTRSWRKQEPLQYPSDSNHLDHSQSELSYRDLVHKDTDERFREALQKLRADRAKQQKELSETTAKRLQYGDYVRKSTSEELLHNVVKPSPWSDFLELKKGNLMSLSKEEKKQLYDQSRSYGDRIRYRNYDMWQENETARLLQQNPLRKDDLQESESSNLTPRQTMNNGSSKSVSRPSNQRETNPSLRTTNKTDVKPKDARTINQIKTNQKNHTITRTDRSNTNHRLERDYENISDYSIHHKSQQQGKKKTVRYAKYDSVGRETSGIEDDDDEDEYDNHSHRPVRQKLRNINNNLYTLHEERSFEDSRYKKR